MRNGLFIIFALLILPDKALGQNLRVADSLLFDSNYDRLIQWADNLLAGKLTADMEFSIATRKAEALIRSGKYQDADAYIKIIGKKASTSYQIALIQIASGSLLLNQGLYDQSVTALQDALTLLEKDKKENSADAAVALAYLGNLYRATGKYAQAEEQLTRSLAIRQRLYPEYNEWIAASYNDLGLAFSQSDNDKALAYYEKASAIYKKLHGENHPKTAIAATNIGYLYSRLELFGDAINNYESALKIWEKIHLQPHPTKAFLLFNLGEIYWKLDNSKSAMGYYEKALREYEQSYGTTHPDISAVRNAIGNLYLDDGDYDAALGWYQKSLHANVNDFTGTDLNQNPKLKTFYNGRTLVNTLLYKAQALEARYYGKTIHMKDLELAIKTIQVCDTLIDRLRQHIANESDKLSLGAIATDVYGTAVRLSYEAAEVAVSKKKWYALAFYFAEKSKSAVLLEAITDFNAKSFARIPEELLDEERQLKASIALTAQLLAQKPSGSQEQSLRERAFQLNRTYDAFTRNLEKNFPQYFNLKYNTMSPSIGDLQLRLDNHTAVISYFTDDKRNQLYIFVITKNRYKVISRPISADLNRNVTGLRNGLYFNTEAVYKKAAEQLSRDLIPAGIPGNITDLVIIPTGRLSIIPFETLITGKLKDQKNSIPYLVNRYSIRYEFSASLILQKANHLPAADLSILLCAPVSFSPEQQLNDLPGTELEVREISRLFATRNLKNESFLRHNANENLAKSGRLRDFKYLHFATHGIVDEKSPELSRIFLNTSSEPEDGSLFTGEIYNLEINAELVTLSACQTGLGKISKGEGVIGLSRALAYAGAKNIIVSFWSVADESTAQLMTLFYKAMLEDPGHHYSKSLQKAKLELMKSEKFKSPYYWAPFVLIGF